MTVRLALRDIIDGMQLQSDEMIAYLNRKTGQVVPVSDEDLAAAEAGEADERRDRRRRQRSPAPSDSGAGRLSVLQGLRS